MTRANDNAAAELNAPRRIGCNDFWAQIPRSANPFSPGSQDAGVWAQSWDAAAHEASTILAASGNLIRHCAQIREGLMQAAGLFRDMRGAKSIAQYLRRMRDVEVEVNVALAHLPAAAIADSAGQKARAS